MYYRPSGRLAGISAGLSYIRTMQQWFLQTASCAVLKTTTSINHEVLASPALVSVLECPDTDKCLSKRWG